MVIYFLVELFRRRDIGYDQYGVPTQGGPPHDQEDFLWSSVVRVSEHASGLDAPTDEGLRGLLLERMLPEGLLLEFYIHY
jgi:hypothetical protein